MSFLNNHRGPFRFCVSRPGKKGSETEWLKGESARDDVEAEARALLTDHRDTITHVSVWSVAENQFVGAFPTKAWA